MSTKRIGIFVLLVSVFSAAAWLTISRLLEVPEVPAPSTAEAPMVPAPDEQPGTEKAPTTSPQITPPLPTTQTPPPPQTSDEDDDEQVEAEQVAAAREQLASADPEQRAEGAEQLGAYPTAESEGLLAQALSTDPAASVRSAAAMSLGYVEKPADQTISTLMTALEDHDEDVRANALSTLEDFLTASEERSSLYQKILSGLTAKANARSVPQDVRESIQEILADQSGSQE